LVKIKYRCQSKKNAPTIFNILIEAVKLGYQKMLIFQIFAVQIFEAFYFGLFEIT